MTVTMFSLKESLVYYLYPRYITAGKGIECLYELIRSQMGADPLNGDVYLFFNKKRDLVKILHWDTDGFILDFQRFDTTV